MNCLHHDDKVLVSRFTLESGALHLEQPEKYESSLREHAQEIRRQLEALDKHREKTDAHRPCSKGEGLS